MTDELSAALNPSSPMDDEKEKSAKTITTVVYVLQAASFLVGITFIAAIIINYMKMSDVRGTRSESHFRWQIRTFWFGLLWSVIAIITAFVFVGYLNPSCHLWNAMSFSALIRVTQTPTRTEEEAHGRKNYSHLLPV